MTPSPQLHALTLIPDEPSKPKPIPTTTPHGDLHHTSTPTRSSTRTLSRQLSALFRATGVWVYPAHLSPAPFRTARDVWGV